MRNALVAALAPYIGKTLTDLDASAIIANFPLEGRPIDLRLFLPKASGSMVFAAERFIDVARELEPLHAAQWAETEKYRDGTEMRPDIGAGMVDEMNGKLLQVTVRRDGELIGHMRWYVNMRSRHTGRSMAHEDTIYIKPEYRCGRAALRLLQYAESCLRILRIEEAFLDDKVDNPSAGRLCDFLGYKIVAHARFKDLEKTPALAAHPMETAHVL
jgi:hypothetical protein